MKTGHNERITDVVTRERSRLLDFIRRRVPNARDAEDILQDVFEELVEANRLLMPIEHVTAWLFRVARNRIIDSFRRKRPIPLEDLGGDRESRQLDELLRSPEAGPESRYLQQVLVDELAAAVEELPPDQRQVFVGHELEGLSFKAMAAETSVSINTLLSRKRYAVKQLRARLQGVHEQIDEIMREVQ